MTPIAAILIITSAVMHAAWNYVSKRQNPTLAFFALTTFAGMVIVLPILLIYRQRLPLIAPSVWLLVAATGVAQAVYMAGLAGAYRRGDISLAYPLVRAMPVLFVATITLLLGNGGEVGRVGLLGMGLIALGCVLIPLREFRPIQASSYFDAVYLMALIAAIGTTGYTLLDDTAMRIMRDAPALQLTTSQVTLLFIALQVTSTAIMVVAVTLLYPPERRQLQRLLRDRARVFTGVLTGVTVMAAYGLVLAAMAYVTNVSYVAAFRQLSIPLGAIMGITWQQEPRYRPKLVGIAIISAGLILVGIG
jgi:drug/metabolite transporter (DMT)-like permease